MPKPVSLIDSLPPEQQETIIGLLEIHPTEKVAQMIAEPPPVGLNVRTHVTTLRRYYARYLGKNKEDNLELAKLFSSPDSDKPLESAAESLISDWAFQLAARPRRSVAAFKALSRWLLKSKQQSQRDREINLIIERLAFDREKFQFNTARAAIALHSQIAKIVANRKLDGEDKVRAARDLLFGPLIGPSASQSQKPAEGQANTPLLAGVPEKSKSENSLH